MELREIRQLIKMLDGTDVSEIEINGEGHTVRIARAVGQTVGTTLVPAVQVPAPNQGQMVAPAPAPAPAAAPEATANEAASNLIPVTSPMVGTFYRAASPESPMFVTEGDVIKKGQVLCIVEAMKLMNEIESDVSGRVVKILKENASPVEYGEELFLVEPG